MNRRSFIGTIRQGASSSGYSHPDIADLAQ
jgi:hypothetical protein